MTFKQKKKLLIFLGGITSNRLIEMCQSYAKKIKKKINFSKLKMLKKFHGLLNSEKIKSLKHSATMKEHCVIVCNIMTVICLTHLIIFTVKSTKSSRHRCLHNGIANFFGLALKSISFFCPLA